MLFRQQHSSKYLLLCPAEVKKSNRFGTTLGQDSIKWCQNFHFWTNYSLRGYCYVQVDFEKMRMRFCSVIFMSGSFIKHAVRELPKCLSSLIACPDRLSIFFHLLAFTVTILFSLQWKCNIHYTLKSKSWIRCTTKRTADNFWTSALD